MLFMMEWGGTALFVPARRRVGLHVVRLAIDGKTLCGSGDRATGKEPRNLVEGWATEQRLVLGQRRSENGSNEIEAIPQLLEELLLEGCNAWIDAMGCQTDIAEATRRQEPTTSFA